ncbi:MAG: amino acid ABC transporter permease [Verrucomicrobiaceae bacterium]|nr:amino acid ABC transporter permease [Verrucomicrobiaceae bacterium]
MARLKPTDTPTGRQTALWTLLWLALAALVLWIVFPSTYRWHWDAFWQYKNLFFRGFLTMLGISLVAMVLSVLVGFSLMLGGRAPWIPLRVAATGYVTLMRGTPLLVVLLLGYYGVVSPLNLCSALVAGTALLALFEAAYLAEIFRGALESISASQREAARAVGFNLIQTYRFVLIPQAVRRTLPGVAGELVSLVKSSSLLSVLGIEEVTQVTRLLNSRNYTALEGFIPLALAYLAVTLPLTWWANRLERRFAYET